MQMFKSHKKGALGDANKKKETCAEHEGKELDLFCKNCQKPVCLICQFGDHKGHDSTLLSKHFDAWKHDIKNTIEKLQVQSRKFNNAVLKIESELQGVKTVRLQQFM